MRCSHVKHSENSGDSVESEARSRARGFSLVEAMVATFLVLFLVTPLVGMQIRVLKMNSVAAQQDIAVWAAEAKLEELTSDNIGGVVSGSEEILLADGRKLLRVWTAHVDNPAPGLKALEVTVTDMSIEAALPVTLWFVLGPNGS